VGTDEELVRLRAEVERLTQGSAWRERILNFVMAAEADGTIKELIDDQMRKRHEDLCRTEDRYIELSEALRNAGVEFNDGRLWLEREGQRVALEDALGSVSAQ
jgi:hypothetical protein